MKKNKKTLFNSMKFNLGEVIILIIITAIIFLGISFMIVFLSKGNTKSEEYAIERDELNDIKEVYQYIKDNYYGNIDQNELIKGAVSGMLSSLDDSNSIYIDEQTSNNFNALINGNYEGIGVQIANDTEGNIVVTGVFENSPAAQAGIKTYDNFISINGEMLEGKTSLEVVNMIKKSSESMLNIIVERANKRISLSVTRQNVVIPSVTSETFQRGTKKIGYIYINIFAANTYSQFKDELNKLEELGLNSLIIDVRENSGGHLSAAADILSLFIGEGKTIYQTRDKNGTLKHYSNGEYNREYPIVVLVNENSASASEILASALKEQYSAKLVGKKTFGKGTVQALKTTSGGIEYKFTTQEWLTPNGNSINKKGIEVDFDVDLSTEYYKEPTDENDSQLQKAIELLK